jgi:phospholipase/carboxylesterase
MKLRNLSLVHLVRQPEEETAQRPPLLLLLHGIGSNEDDLFSLAPYLDSRFLIVSARAPVVMGQGSFGWFNIELTPQGMVADLDQAEHSRQLLVKFIEELFETYSIDSSGIYLMGFSQGAMMSLALALTQPDKVAGVVAMSGRLPSQALWQTLVPEALRGMPVMVTHGIYDPVLPIGEGRALREKLETLPVALSYREYPMGHEVSLESLRDVSLWLSSSLDSRF